MRTRCQIAAEKSRIFGLEGVHGDPLKEVKQVGVHHKVSELEACMIPQLQRSEIQILLKAGHTQEEAAEICKVSLRTVQRVISKTSG